MGRLTLFGIQNVGALAIGAAMAAVEVATQRTLPEEGSQGVSLDALFVQFRKEV
jgi:hypothetical protein